MTSLGVLDQSPLRSGGPAARAIRETIELAEACDRLGFHRYWLSEHHASGALAGSAPEVLIGQVAARDFKARLRSYELLAEAFELPGTDAPSAARA